MSTFCGSRLQMFPQRKYLASFRNSSFCYWIKFGLVKEDVDISHCSSITNKTCENNGYRRLSNACFPRHARFRSLIWRRRSCFSCPTYLDLAWNAQQTNFKQYFSHVIWVKISLNCFIISGKVFHDIHVIVAVYFRKFVFASACRQTFQKFSNLSERNKNSALLILSVRCWKIRNSYFSFREPFNVPRISWAK